MWFLIDKIQFILLTLVQHLIQGFLVSNNVFFYLCDDVGIVHLQVLLLNMEAIMGFQQSVTSRRQSYVFPAVCHFQEAIMCVSSSLPVTSRRRQSYVFPAVCLSPPGGGNHVCFQQSICVSSSLSVSPPEPLCTILGRMYSLATLILYLQHQQ